MSEISEQRGAGSRVLSVSALTRMVKELLEREFPRVVVEGEVSNLARPASGHWYFTLKDAHAQVRCAMFRNRNRLVRFRPDEGMQVVVRGAISLYESRGDFQLIAEAIEQAGEGALQRAFEELKARLAAEGVFDDARKRPVPAVPRHLGVITSPTGAAIRDVLNVLARRFPAIDVTVLPVQVQGDAAAAQIVRALASANRFNDPPFDLLLLTRGGGSLEDLWPFNEEIVARAIRDSEIPVVSAVGHETDFTIADFAADLRAPTPSAAAELISPDQFEWQQRLLELAAKLVARLGTRLDALGERVSWLHRQVRDPKRRLQELAQRVDDLDLRLSRGVAARIAEAGSRTALAHSRLASPRQRIVQAALNLQNRELRMRGAMTSVLQRRAQSLDATSHALNALSPLATLDRGYAIVTTEGGSGRVVTDSRQVREGERIAARFRRGTIIASVEERRDETPE